MRLKQKSLLKTREDVCVFRDHKMFHLSREKKSDIMYENGEVYIC
jgi:hypothetical protein